MKFYKKHLFSLIMGISLLSFSIFPGYVNAGGLVPCGGKTEPDCTICYLAKGIENIVTLIMGLLVITGVLIIVVAGIMYIVSSGNPQMITTAKTAMKNALIGVVIVLTAYLTITFILVSMFNNSGSDLKVSEGGLSGMDGGSSWTFTCN